MRRLRALLVLLAAACMGAANAQRIDETCLELWGPGVSAQPGSWASGMQLNNTCALTVPINGGLGTPRPPPSVPPPPAAPPLKPPPAVTVGLFVHTWHDLDTKRRVMFESPWAFGWWWWGRPAFAGGDLAQYHWNNSAMVDYHINNFKALGADFLFLDLTNGPMDGVLAGAHALCKRLKKRLAAGETVPRVVLWIDRQENAQQYWDQFYAKYRSVTFQWEGKPLLLINGLSGGWRNFLGQLRPLPAAGSGVLDRFTVRWCWGLLRGASGTMWTFKEDFSTPKPYKYNGANEQIGMAFASQGMQPMSVGDSRRQCRQDGAFFKSQIDNLLRYRPKIVTITGYNEWMAIDMAQAGQPPQLVDLYGQECSHDIEPMKGGHTDRYMRMAQRFISALHKLYPLVASMYDA